jgi:hypothetical protein
MAEKLPKFKTPLEWQIDRRHRIQRFLFTLYNFLAEHSEFPNENDDVWYPMVRMVDAAFSLWRSAFLTNVQRERKTIYAHTKEFIQKVLEQNSITFADDYRMCELTVGYYNANARYRLERMYGFNEDLLQVETIKRIDQLRKVDVEKIKQSDLWDKYYSALYDCFEEFKINWRKNIRPQDGDPTKPRRRRRQPTRDGGSTEPQPHRRSRR